MKRDKSKIILLGIVTLALFLRLAAVFTQEESKRLPLSDAKQYDNMAVNIISGYGLAQTNGDERVPTAYRTPVFPLFLAFVYAFFGHSYLAVKIIQAILGVLLCIIIFFIANIIYDNVRIGLIASFILAIYKPFVSGFYYYGGPAVLYSEYFYAFIAGLTSLTLFLFIKKDKIFLGILSGIFIGATVLTRPEFVFYPMLLLLYLFCMSARKFARKFFIVYLFISLTIAPWIIRNYIIFGKFIPLSTIGGYSFCLGNNSSANGGWAFPSYQGEIFENMEHMTEYEWTRLCFRKGLEEWRNTPKRLPKLFIKKMIVHWAPFEDGKKIFNPHYALILFLGSIGILFFRRHVIEEGILYVLFITTTLVAIVIWGDPRYRYAFEPYLIIFSALAIDNMFNYLKGKVSYGEQR
jgi:hypothetical protein